MKTKLLVIFLFLTCALMAQENYIVTDTSKIITIKLTDRGELLNAQGCERILKNQSVIYSPFDITEYGLANGKVYISKEYITGGSSCRVFLELLFKGKTSLYYYRNEETKSYILENEEGNSWQVPKKSTGQPKSDYREALATVYADCPEVSDAVKVAGYQKKMMALLAERYSKCENKPFPFFKYGLLAGYGFTGLNYIAGVSGDYFQQENKYFKNADFKYDGGFIFGLFIDQPLSVSDFSVHPEIYFTKNDFFSAYEMDGYYIEAEIHTVAVNIPVLFRYTFPLANARPYLNAGVIYAYQFKDDFSVLTMPEDEGEYPAPAVTNQAGLSAGCGYQFDLTYRMRLYVDLRYNYLYGMRVSGQESYRKNEFQFSAAISF